MNAEFDISIVVSSYNRENKVRQTIDSIFKNDLSVFTAVELIIIDDGSPQPVENVLPSANEVCRRGAEAQNYFICISQCFCASGISIIHRLIPFPRPQINDPLLSRESRCNIISFIILHLEMQVRKSRVTRVAAVSDMLTFYNSVANIY